jgi:hypothetical protein
MKRIIFSSQIGAAEKKTDNSANKMLRIILQKRARWDAVKILSKSLYGG